MDNKGTLRPLVVIGEHHRKATERPMIKGIAGAAVPDFLEQHKID